MEDMKARQDHEKEQVKNLVLSAVKGQAEEQAQDALQAQQKVGRQRNLGDFIPII